MRRSVISCQRVLAHQEPQNKDVEVAVDSSVVFGVEMGEHKLSAGPLGGNGWHSDHQYKDTCR
jgi:hypothetical protein